MFNRSLPPFDSGPGPTTAAYTASAAENPGGPITGPRTLSGISIGSAFSGRHVVAAIMLQRSGSAGTSIVTGVSIGGVAATKLGSTAFSGNANDHLVEFWIAAVPTGTTADVVLTFTDSIFRWATSLFAITGYSSLNDSDAVGTTSNIAISGTVDVRANGCAIAAVTNNGANTYSWTGLTERVDGTYGNTYSAASDDFVSASPGLSVTATQSSNNSPQALAIISL